MSKKNILVTGGEGFIGSHLCENLVNNGHKVTALVQYNSFNSWGWLDHIPPETKKKLNIVLGDVRDSYGIKKIVIDGVIVLR